MTTTPGRGRRPSEYHEGRIGSSTEATPGARGTRSARHAIIDAGAGVAYRHGMRSRDLAVAGAVGWLIILALAGPAAAQAQADVAKQLRVEWEAVNEACCPPRLVGHVYNASTYRIGSVRLRVETLDASNQVVNESLAWIYVNVPARDRAAFSIRRPSKGESYRLAVESFVLIAREPMTETP
jgi:hypothetical protein